MVSQILEPPEIDVMKKMMRNRGWDRGKKKTYSYTAPE
jgi:hypothetical protein